jgi:hypothetical protein
LTAHIFCSGFCPIFWSNFIISNLKTKYEIEIELLKINPDKENAVAISIQDETKKIIFIHNIYGDLN